MSDMKCPFCKGELVGTMGHPICRNQNCVMCDDPMPQDLLEELIRTREELYKANAELDYIKEQVEKSNAFIRARIKVAADQIARGIIDQVEIIKSQKDVK